MKKLIVFTDLDGTLLNHDSYSWEQAMPAIEALKQHNFPMVINSSKTSSEIRRIREKMQNKSPYICENGAVVHLNEIMLETPQQKMHEMFFAEPYSYILDVLNEIKSTHQFDMSGFNDIDIEYLMEITGLDNIDATDAKQREATEPLVWSDSDESLSLFKELLHRKNLTLSRGGRFYHVMSPVNKGDSIRYLIERYQTMEPDTHWVSVALGDSFNDISMLEQVDYPVLINNPRTEKPDVTHIPNLVESTLPGPAGWNIEVLNIINKLTGAE